jgi:Na+/H+ antiporter NhaD/arsenite permease-like protein
LNECGALSYLGTVLDKYVHNVYAYGVINGFLSMIVDNVPCVMAGMNIFEVSVNVNPDFAVDGLYWQLLAYCSAFGGMTLLFGSLAGHSVMRIEKLRYSWFCRHMIWRIAVSWIFGLFVFWLIH